MLETRLQEWSKWRSRLKNFEAEASGIQGQLSRIQEKIELCKREIRRLERTGLPRSASGPASLVDA
jgi:hypothetical protein